MYLPIEPPPGFARINTEYQAGKPVVRWWAGSLVRWYDRLLGPVGGFRKRADNAVTGLCRAILPWRASSLARWIALGTHSGLHIQSTSGVITDITPSGFSAGDEDESAAVGFGSGTYGTGTYGTPRPDTGQTIPALVWDLDTWGTYLVACAFSDGRLFEWQLDTGSDAAVITNAPTDCQGLVVSKDGFLLALGAGGDPRKVAWSDQGVNTTWTPSATNQAGDFTLVTSGVIRKGIRLGSLVLILTDLDAHVGAFVGLPNVYIFDKVGEGCGALSKGSVVAVGEMAVWWSFSGFWVYDGQARPIACEVYDYLTQNLNEGQVSKISGFHNSEQGEVWWFYPSTAGSENDSYVFWDYRRNVWGTGSLVRLCGAQRGVFKYPMCVSLDGYVYEHEVGNDYEDATIYAETGPFEAGEGDRVMRVSELIADEGSEGQVTLSFKTRDRPNGDETTIASVTLGADGRGFPRFTARQVRMRAEFTANANARLGRTRMSVMAGGRR
jgi:hypothetical protein